MEDRWRRAARLLAGALVVSSTPLIGSFATAGRSVQAASAAAARAAQGGRAAEASATAGPLVGKYCLTCHNDRLQTAGLSLEKISLERPAAGAATWEKVVRKLRSGAMPPPGAPRPDPATARDFVTSLTRALDDVARVAPNPGRSVLHRLNRTEYQNAVRDLLALEIDSRSLLPPDDEDHGFDNIADVLSVSPTLLERYQSAAQRISQLAVGDPAVRPVFETYTVPERLVQDDRTSDDLPFGSRGIAITHHFPLDGEYVVRLRLRRTLYLYIRGLGLSHQLDLRVDGERVGLLSVGGEHEPNSGLPPETNAGEVIGDPAWEDYAHRADERLEVRFTARAGTRVVAVAFDKDLALPEGILDVPLNMATFHYANDEMQRGNPAIASVTIAGPYEAQGPGDTASRRRIFVCDPKASRRAEGRCVRQILGDLARRAYRRPVTSADLDTLMPFFETGKRESQRGVDGGIQLALERILTDPEFLFRLEPDRRGVAPGSAYRLSDLEIASRLSFFLWSSSPDDELIDLAAGGRLSNPQVLDQQVRRLLLDGRSQALAQNFGGQWLGLRYMRAVNPDPAMFPEFTENLRQAMQRETELFLESQIRDDQSLVSLLTANYTFLNETLARHYEVSGIYGPAFRRVSLDDDVRKGLLGQASLMTATSYASRTSPVLRGKWLLDTFLAAPPPEPPPNVPALPERGPDGQARSVRQRLEEHRKNPVCASCHRTIDPMGFALENFDAIGKWRTVNEGRTRSEEGDPIDASGVLLDGTAFTGVKELRRVLAGNRQEEFVLAVVERLLTYALGRGLEFYDMPAVRQIVRESAVSNYSWSAVIGGVVKSVPFQMRRAAS